MKVRTNARQVAARLEQRAREAEQVTARALQQHAPEAVADAKGNTPRDSGASVAGWRASKTGEGFALRNVRRRARFVLGGALITVGAASARRTISKNRKQIARAIKEG